MKSLSSKTYQCGVTIQGLTTLSGTVYLTGITNTASWDHVIVGTTAQGQIYTRTYAQLMSDITSGIGLSGYVPTSRTLTINGVSYDLTANRSWTITTPYVSKLQHQVKAGVAINKGQAVYVTSADGTNMIVGLASNASEATSSKTMGLLDATVSTNGFANVVTEGLLDGLDTSTAGAAGDPVWLGTGGNLIYGLANKPYAPAHLVFIGIVTRKNSNNGEIFVKVQNGFELNEIHDVDLKTNLPVNGELLGFNGTLWVNKTIAGWLGYTPANASGTTNYISKFTGSTTLGNSQIFDNGTNVGIGTTSPIYKLHVSNNANGFISRFTGGASSDVNIGIFGYTGAFGSIGTESNHPLNIFTSGTDRMTISTSGNVGIGTTSPAYKLDVKGNLSVATMPTTNTVMAAFMNGATEGIEFGHTGSNGVYGITNANYIGSSYFVSGSFRSLAFVTSNAAQMVITTTGNVGIGTTSPSQKLDVSGVTSTQGLYIPGLYTFGQASSGIEMQLTSASYNAIRFFQGSDWTGVIHSFGRSWAGGVSVGMVNIEGYNGVTIGAWNIPTATFLSSGNVGIGTTSPSDKLQVVASTYNGITITTPDVATFKMRSSSGATSWGFATTNLAANDFGIYQSNSSGGDPINAGTARLYFNGSGNVGIGTATPGYKLDVSGIINTTSAPGSYGTIIRVRDTVTGGTESFGGVHFTSSPGTDYTIGKWTTAAGAGLLQIRDQAGNQFVTINSSGNVGIGTTSPSDKLQVQNGNLSLYSNSYGNTGLIRHFGTDSLEKYQQGLTTGGDFYQYTFSGLNHIFYTNNGNERMRITSGGNILMNTVATPTTGGFTNTTLSVKQVADGLYGGGLHIEENATTSVAYFGFNGSVFNIGTSYRTTGNYRPIAFSTNGSERLRIDNAGNVGIGTTSPTYKLQLENGSQYIVGGLGAINSSPYTSANRLIFNNDYNDIARGPNKITLYDGSWLGGFGIHNNTMAYYSGGVHEWYLATNASNPASLMTLLANGNLGIGISPATRLNIYGVDPIFRMSTADNSMDIKYTTSGGGAAQRISIGAGASTEHLVVLNSGNVGIGTTTPATLLDVNGVITATGGNSTNWNTAYGWGNHASASYVPQARTLTINGTSYDLSANRSWTIATTTPGGSDTQVQYNSSGTLAGASALIYNSTTNRVGINQASPGYDLDVNGQVRVQDKLRIGTGNGVVHMSSTATINASATTIVWAQTVSVGVCAFIEYYILNNNSLTDQRAGTIIVTWNQSGTPTIAHTETTTPDIGSTTAINFTSSLVGSSAQINAVNSSANPYTMVMSYKYF